jgi:hypothetical protein
MSAAQAFAYCQAVHDLRTCPVEVGSPQTQTQRLQVVRVIDLLVSQDEEERASAEELAIQTFHAELEAQAEVAAAAAVSALTEGHTHIVSDANSPTEETKGGKNGPHSPPLGVGDRGLSSLQSPAKPPPVSRDTTEEHIFQMSKHPGGISQFGMHAYNKTLGRKKANTGPPPLSAPFAKSTTFPAIGARTSNGAGHPVPNGYIATTESEKTSRSSSPMDVATNAPIGGRIPGGATPPGAQNSAPLSKAPLDGAALLQTLQAHPPRNPPPQHSRADALGKHPGRGLSPQLPIAGELHIPHSSDEGENSNAEDDEEGFIISQRSAQNAMFATVTDENAAEVSGVNYRTLASSGLSVIETDLSSLAATAGNSVMDDAMVLSPDCANTPGGEFSYISSSTSCNSRPSRPISMLVDSPMVAGGVMSPSVSSGPSSTATTDSMDLSVDGCVMRLAPLSPMITAPTLQRSASGKHTASGKHSLPPTSPPTTLPLPTQATRTVSVENQGSDYDEAVRSATATGSGSTRSASNETPSTSVKSGKSRRLSGTKVLANALRAGIKILTGGGGSGGNSGTSTPENGTKPTTSQKKNTTVTLQQPYQRSPVSDKLPFHKGSPNADDPSPTGEGSLRPHSLQTQSTDSCTTASLSHSNHSTPTNYQAAVTATLVSQKVGTD